MSPSTKTRKKKLTTASDGYYKSYIGWKLCDDGQRRQHQFNLGTDKHLAERRKTRIQDLYTDDCRASAQDHWSARGLSYAKQIASGEAPQFFEPPQPQFAMPSEPLYSNRITAADLMNVGYAQAFEQTKEAYPSVSDFQPDLERLATSRAANESLVVARKSQLENELKIMGALPSSQTLEQLTGITLLQALDLFTEALKADPQSRTTEGGLSQWGKNKTDMVETLKFFFSDMNQDVGKIGKSECESLIKILSSRPRTKRGTSLKKNTARHLIWLTRVFLKWLDGSAIAWDKPAKFDISARVQYRVPDITELAASLEHDEIVTIPLDQLIFIISHATELEKLYIGLAMNAAYGADQIGRLQIEWIKWDLSQMKGARLKKSTASRHYLWACNLARLKNIIGDRTSGTIFINDDDGKPLVIVYRLELAPSA